MWYVVCDEWCVVCSVCFLVCGECNEWLVVCDVIGLPQEIFSDLCRTDFTLFLFGSAPFAFGSPSVWHPSRLQPVYVFTPFVFLHTLSHPSTFRVPVPFHSSPCLWPYFLFAVPRFLLFSFEPYPLSSLLTSASLFPARHSSRLIIPFGSPSLSARHPCWSLMLSSCLRLSLVSFHCVLSFEAYPLSSLLTSASLFRARHSFRLVIPFGSPSLSARHPCRPFSAFFLSASFPRLLSLSRPFALHGTSSLSRPRAPRCPYHLQCPRRSSQPRTS